jgi:hypothetical protein
MNLRQSSVILGVLALPAAAWAQGELYSNGSPTPSNPGLATGAVTLSGVPAPAGAQWSETPRDAAGANALAGFATHASGASGPFRFADDVAAPAGGWRVESVSFYAYQPEAAGNPFVGLSLRVWRGQPGQPGSEVVFGDATTSRLIAAQALDLYRVFNSTATPSPQTPDTARRVWRLDAGLTTGFGGPLQLEAGAYWLDWQITAVGGGTAYTPAVTEAGQRGRANANALQFRPAAPPTVGVWLAAVDPGKPESAADVAQELAFIVRGGAGCAGDLNGDGVVDFNDFLTYLNGYNAGLPEADLNRDGTIDFNDLLEFLNRYNTPCA